MNHLPYVAGAYALGVAVPAGFALAAAARLKTAKRRLAAIDPRAARRAQGYEAPPPAPPPNDETPR